MINGLKYGICIVGISALTACGSLDHLGKEPTMSDMTLDENSMPEANRVQVPMPSSIYSMNNKTSDAASLWSSSNTSLFGDQRASNIGDILTVNIDIQDNASLKNQTQQSRSAGNSMGFPTFFGYEKKIDKILPGVGVDDLPTSGNVVDLGSTSNATGSGSVNRNEKISLKVAALIIDELPNGNFVIAGRQEVRVNFELRELRVAGIIRPEDISANNSIEYDKIAEARIAYGGRGQISAVQQPAIGKQVIDLVLPY